MFLAEILSYLDTKYCIKMRLNGPWPKGPFLWLHGASLGECNMLLNLSDLLKRDIPDCPPILITSQKAEVVKYLQNAKNITIRIAPAPTKKATNKFVNCVKPLALILAENELWPNYVSNKYPVALISGRFNNALPWLNYSQIKFAAMQTKIDAKKILAKGGKVNTICSDLKLLQWAMNDCKQIKKDATIEVTFVSFHLNEFKSLLRMTNCILNQKKVAVLIPRFPNEADLFKRKLQKYKIKTLNWPNFEPGKISIVYSFGQVKNILSISHNAVIGGSFGRTPGVHNFFEPMCMGVPTYVGNNLKGHENIAYELLKNKALLQINSKCDFIQCNQPQKIAIEQCIAKEKDKICKSYKMLLEFLKEKVL